MKKIAFIIQHLANGGAERTVSNLSLAFKDEFDVSLIVFDGKHRTYPYGGKMFDLNTPPAKSVLGKMLNIVKRISRTRKIRKQEKFDCVISFMFGANFVNVLSKCGEKTIISERNYISAYGIGLYNQSRVRFMVSRCDKDVALSKMVAYDLIHNFGIPESKVETIYNPIDIERISGLSAQPCSYVFREGCFYIVTVGRLVKQKGQWHLIKAFSEFHKTTPNSKLLILGDGPYKSKLEKLATELNVQNAVDFLGFVENPYSYLGRASCFVFPSLFEGLGNALIEAMACQVPVISYDCLAGPHELIAPNTDISKSAKGVEWHECGILVSPPSNEEDMTTNIEQCDYNLAKALTELAQKPDLAREIVNNATNRIQKFLPNAILNDWRKLF